MRKIAFLFSLFIGAQAFSFAVVNLGFNRFSDFAAVSPDGKTVFVGNPNSLDINVVDVKNAALKKTIPLGVLPSGMNITPDNCKLYVASFVGNCLFVINPKNGQLVKTISFSRPRSVTVSPDGRRAYICVASEENITGKLIALNTKNDKQVFAAPINTPPLFSAVSPNSKTIYVTSFMGDATKVARNGKVLGVIPTGSLAAIGVSFDGKRIFGVGGSPGHIMEFDAKTGAIIAAHAVPFASCAFTCTPGPKNKYLFFPFLGTQTVVRIDTKTGRTDNLSFSSVGFQVGISANKKVLAVPNPSISEEMPDTVTITTPKSLRRK